MTSTAEKTIKAKRRMSGHHGRLAVQDNFLNIGDCWVTEVAVSLWMSSPVYQWQNLADDLGYSYVEIEELERRERNLGTNPVYELLRTWGRREGSTLRVLQEKLKSLGRYDVSRLLDEAILGEFCLECKIWNEDGDTDFTVHTNNTSTLDQALEQFLADHNIDKDNIVFVSPANSGFILDWTTNASKLKGRELVISVDNFSRLSEVLRSYNKTEDDSSISSRDFASLSTEHPHIIHKHYFAFNACNIGTLHATTPPPCVMQNVHDNVLLRKQSSKQQIQNSKSSSLTSAYNVPQKFFYENEQPENDEIPTTMPPPPPPRQPRNERDTSKQTTSNIVKQDWIERKQLKKKSLQEQLKMKVPPPLPKRQVHGSAAQDANTAYYGDHSCATSRDVSSSNVVNVNRNETADVIESLDYLMLEDKEIEDAKIDRASSASQNYASEISKSLEDMCTENPAWHPMLTSNFENIQQVTEQYRRQDGWYMIHVYEGQIILTVTFQKVLKHFQIFQNAQGKVYFDEEDYKSKTLEDLIEVYKFQDLPVKNMSGECRRSSTDTRYVEMKPKPPPSGSHIRLKRPIPIDWDIGY
ncbi:uncharacterized protein LOC100368082 [Saccoglossus kowalevskii]|uniref:Uncharacterized protein LOC100368082 n=1 Tax=Saccoglossus kowalevskii TaxID=10224 RepID=A0ABM0GVC0_SACKO|nr:PREDICTED: uncharacterized protein LOC100368082 [Saccoglossus kowalevskii]